jgi:hypothetical protein
MPKLVGLYAVPLAAGTLSEREWEAIIRRGPDAPHR